MATITEIIGTPEVSFANRAAVHGYKDIAELLLANKADVNAEDNNGYSPLCRAETNGHIDMAELLRQHGGQDVSTPMQPSPVSEDIHSAAASGDLGTVVSSQTAQRRESTAILKSGTVCFLDRKGNFGCTKQNWLTKGFFDTMPIIYQIDGKVTEEIAKKEKHYSAWEYKGTITAGWHTVSAAFYQQVGNVVGRGSDMTVGFAAVSGNTYEVDSLMIQGRWALIILDVTDKNHTQPPSCWGQMNPSEDKK